MTTLKQDFGVIEKPKPQAVAEDLSRTAYSRPRRQKVAPLRTAFMDPVENNIPKHKTRSELRRTLRSINKPHRSFDIDGDGIVDTIDYRLSAQFDSDGNGMIDPHERKQGRRMIASNIVDFKEDVRAWRGLPQTHASKRKEHVEGIASYDAKEFQRHYDVYRKDRTTFVNRSGYKCKGLVFSNRDPAKYDTTSYGGRPPTIRKPETMERCKSLTEMRRTRKERDQEANIAQGEASLAARAKLRGKEQFRRISPLVDQKVHNFHFLHKHLNETRESVVPMVEEPTKQYRRTRQSSDGTRTTEILTFKLAG